MCCMVAADSTVDIDDTGRSILVWLAELLDDFWEATRLVVGFVNQFAVCCQSH
jgi:hypothetical protein